MKKSLFILIAALCCLPTTLFAQTKCHVRVNISAFSQGEIDRMGAEVREKTCIDAIAGSALRFDDQGRPVAWFRQGKVTWAKDGENDTMEINSLDGTYKYVGKASTEGDIFKFEGVDGRARVTGKLEITRTDGKVSEFLYQYAGPRFGIVQYKPGS